MYLLSCNKISTETDRFVGKFDSPLSIRLPSKVKKHFKLDVQYTVCLLTYIIVKITCCETVTVLTPKELVSILRP